MPKRRGRQDDNQHQRSDGGGVSAGKRSRPARQPKHLYVVLDDSEKGLSVHKIDPDSFDSNSDDSDSDDGRSPRVPAADRLPEPPALRLETPALVYDTETAGLAFGPAVPARLRCGLSFVVAARGTLYAFSAPASNKEGSFQVMSWAPTSSSHEQQNYFTRYPSEEDLQGRYSWTALPGPPPPFDAHDVIVSYAVHPDGRTIVMTTASGGIPSKMKSTYSFSTKYRVWRWHDWVLPFRGQAHYDSELDAWVGLNMSDEIICCQVPNDIGSETPVKLGTKQLDWQVALDNLFPEESKRHSEPSLTYMGRSKFCIVQSETLRKKRASKQERERYALEEDDDDDDDDGCVLHLTIFGLKYCHRGELRGTKHRSTCSYRLSRHRLFYSPLALWV